MLLQIQEPGDSILSSKTNEVAVGIDLGTTHSLVAVSFEQVPQVIETKGGDLLIPSLVAYGKDIVVGQEALEIFNENPDMVAFSTKRLMGRTLKEVQKNPYLKHFPFVTEREPLFLNYGAHQVRPVEVAAEILKFLKEQAEFSLKSPIKQAVITVPAYFDDAARSATRVAANMAGLEVLRLISEPTAAAFAYGLDKEVEGLYAVYDLGGGTFDFTLLKIQEGVFQVLATGGNLTLGGDDFDHLILENFLKEGEQNLPLKERVSALRKVRSLKESLVLKKEGRVTLTLKEQNQEYMLTQRELKEILAPLIKQTLLICEEVLTNAQVEKQGIKGIIMVGGATRTLAVQELVQGFFNQSLLNDLNPDQVVALGAALQAASLTQGQSKNLLLDVTPLSLGIETLGGIVEKIIPRNSPIPSAKAQDFTTYQDNQTALSIHVVQGERELVKDCLSLAKFELKGIPQMAAGAPRIRVTYSIDADGILSVRAQELHTGVEQAIEIQPTSGLSLDFIQELIQESFVTAKEDIKMRLAVQEEVKLKQLINIIESALKQEGNLLKSRERENIEKKLKEAQELLEKGADLTAIKTLYQTLNSLTQEFAKRRLEKNLQGTHFEDEEDQKK